MSEFTIPGELPSMNEIIAASKKHHMVYANMKKDYTALVQISAGNLPKFNKADFEVTWYCKDKRKDPDNIAGGGTKFILDGLVKAGKLKNDGWNEIGEIRNYFEVDKSNPRVVVKMKEVG
ncbi:Holliday junction resolvase [Oceanobacillus arenosus]|uniref:Holliday junction resolvase n=1 Tax=Oceanobacillus arenosus TaxID=1229153 RepID=A0A3D8PQP6_9BACI|nr:Holliday junction resolvase [Oceanobacillus arenosus]RDW17611.1 Holliday junction resolvase [Oceanobacillus arenosus]